MLAHVERTTTDNLITWQAIKSHGKNKQEDYSEGVRSSITVKLYSQSLSQDIVSQPSLRMLLQLQIISKGTCIETLRNGQ